MICFYTTFTNFLIRRTSEQTPLLELTIGGRHLAPLSTSMAAMCKTHHIPYETHKYRITEISTTYMLRLLELGLSPMDTSSAQLRQPIYVAIDVELSPDGQKINQLGVSTLDTMDIPSVDDLDDADVARVIQSFCFCTSKVKLHRKRNTSHTILKRDRVFLYGTPEVVEHNQLFNIMDELLKVNDGNGGLRYIVIVGHDVKADVRMLRDFTGVDMNDHGNVVALLDTQQIFRHVFTHSTYKKVSLLGALRTVDLPNTELHIAGNDALYTLKLMLLLFCHHRRQQKESDAFKTISVEDGIREELWDCQLKAVERLARCFWRAPASYKKQRTHVRPERCGSTNLFEHELDEIGLGDLLNF